jgi:hypothetical protein
VAQNLTTAENARLFAPLNLSFADGVKSRPDTGVIRFLARLAPGGQPDAGSGSAPERHRRAGMDFTLT